MKKLIIIPATLIVALVTLCSCEKLVGTSKPIELYVFEFILSSGSPVNFEMSDTLIPFAFIL